MSSTVLDWYNYWFNKDGSGGGSAPLNIDTSVAPESSRVNNPFITRPSTPVVESIKIAENWDTGTPTGSPTSSGSSTPTPTNVVDPMQVEYDKYFR